MRVSLLKLLAEAQQVVSLSEGRRMVIGGIVKLNGQPVTDLSQAVEVNPGDTIQVGKRSPIVVSDDTLRKCNEQA
jgi:ribosomal protein S4